MKTNTASTAAKLSTFVRDSARHPVTDDLAGLEHLVPEAPSEPEQLALFRAKLPALLDLRGRGQAHALQVQRLIKLLAKEPHLVEVWIDVANALTILTNSTHLALMLLPVRSDDDRWARGDFGRHLLNRARAQGDEQDVALARRVVGRLPRAPRANLVHEPEAVQEMIGTMARRAAALNPTPSSATRAGHPGVHALEHADSLEAFFDAPPDLGDLLAQAKALLTRLDRWRIYGLPQESDEAAIEGGLILAYAKLLQVALWPALDQADLAAKAAARDFVASRSTDPDQYRALWEIALGQGETIAGQSDRFLRLPPQG